VVEGGLPFEGCTLVDLNGDGRPELLANTHEGGKGGKVRSLAERRRGGRDRSDNI
jgi:hypothetical protein